jgi:hypothetical protein
MRIIFISFNVFSFGCNAVFAQKKKDKEKTFSSLALADLITIIPNGPIKQTNYQSLNCSEYL